MTSDLRTAFRSLRKTPGFTVVAIAIVAIGIGAATAMFSTVNALVLRPISLPEPDRLVAAYETNLTRNLPFFSVSIPNYLDWQERAQSFTALAAMNWRSMNLTGKGDPELVAVRAVTANFLPTFGLKTALGRNFLSTEDRPGGAQVAVISDSFWQSHFGRAPNVVGKTLTFDSVPYTIVGVLAPGQQLPGWLQVAVPLAANREQESRTNHEMEVYGRLKPGVTIEQAETELKAIATNIWTEHPEMDRGWSNRLVPYTREVVGDGVRQALYVLLGSVGLLLLIACANLSNLLLLRASARVHELAIRTALGATRGRIIRQIVTESLAVTVVGGAVGVLLSLWAVDLMHSLPLPRADEISIDVRVLAAACAATIFAGLCAGVGPALKASRQTRPQEALKSHAPRSGHRSALRDTMVVLQLAVSLTLLVGAALLGRSFVRLLGVNPGFSTENVLTLSLRPVGDAAPFYEKLTALIAGLPGVVGVGVTSSLPLTEGNTSLNVFPQGRSIVPSGQSVQANWRLVDGGYFNAMQIPLVRGRTFAGMTPDEARKSAIISASLARQLWGDQDPVGRQFDPGGNHRLLDVVGVVGDVRSEKLGVEPYPTFYWSMHRFIYGPMKLVVHSTSSLTPLLPAIRAAIKDLDPTVPVFWVNTLEDLRASSLQQERMILSLLAGFTGVALMLAALGTYGVIAFTVQQRTQEIGIRLAIGAQAGDILQLVIGQGMRLVLAGCLLGLAGALAASRLLSTLLYQTGTTDPMSYLAATASLAAIALGAAFLPAHRATKVDPMVALRSE